MYSPVEMCKCVGVEIRPPTFPTHPQPLSSRKRGVKTIQYHPQPLSSRKRGVKTIQYHPQSPRASDHGLSKRHPSGG
jgi:hypothetical protein